MRYYVDGKEISKETADKIKVEKYEVTFKTVSTVRGRKNFDTIEEAVEYAKSIKEKEPIIYEKRKVIVDL